jgi:ATP/maltotriose-dependent transcriptional regulator MalT
MLNLMPHTVSDYRLQYNDINGILGVTQAKKIQKGIALELYNQGIDTKDIILQTGLSIGVVRKIIVTSSMFKSKQKIRDKEILRMADRGISLKYIAKKFSVSVATVKHVRSKKIT